MLNRTVFFQRGPLSPLRFVSIVLLSTVYGCAENPAEIAPAHIPQKNYDAYSCEELLQEVSIVDFKLKEAYLELEGKYENDKDWATWGTLVFPFNLIWLEGKGSSEAHEYSRLLGMREAIERSAEEKNCFESK